MGQNSVSNTNQYQAVLRGFVDLHPQNFQYQYALCIVRDFHLVERRGKTNATTPVTWRMQDTEGRDKKHIVVWGTKPCPLGKALCECTKFQSGQSTKRNSEWEQSSSSPVQKPG